MEIITYSKNIFIPLTTACRNNCSYCRFKAKGNQINITSLAEIEEVLAQAKEAGCKEVLFTCGSQPEQVAGFEKKIKEETGFESIIELAIAASKMALDYGLLPHSNLGVISKKDLEEVAQYNASLGLMLETTAEVSAHQYSPTKTPKVRTEFIAAAGELEIPFTSGLLLGIGESRSDRIKSLKLLKQLQEEYGHLQEVIIQSVDPPTNIDLTNPELEVVIDTLKLAKQILPAEIALQVPPNLVDLETDVQALVDDLGGISPLTIDYINPDHGWPEIEELEASCPEVNFRERLAVYPQYLTQDYLPELVWNCIQREGWINEFKTTAGSR